LERSSYSLRKLTSWHSLNGPRKTTKNHTQKTTHCPHEDLNQVPQNINQECYCYTIQVWHWHSTRCNATLASLSILITRHKIKGFATSIHPSSYINTHTDMYSYKLTVSSTCDLNAEYMKSQMKLRLISKQTAADLQKKTNTPQQRNHLFSS
jgi:hypothetical protein